MNMKKSLLAGVILSAACAGANAGVINVGGVQWNTDSFFDFTSNSNLIEDQLDISNGVDELKGFGLVTNINGTGEAVFCPGGCELTYVFGDFTATYFGVNSGGETIIGFTGGYIDFYVDSATAYNPDAQATAADGDLWLRLEAHDVFNAEFGANVSLFATLTSFGVGTDTGDGDGLMDVAGGLAALNFYTDTQSDGADFVFSSSFQPFPNGGAQSDGYELFGTADIRGNSTAVPEPSSLALLGLGLIAVAGGVRKRKA
ncbi:MAG: PEP-CTERM sorting domain-containing protein [Hahellaceae bacterium]|nr:PEP-CTERM sorting domain-containing protein [Hahellaceae bacterium]